MFWPARLAVATLLGLATAASLLGGCSMFGGGDSKPETTAATTPSQVSPTTKASADQIDIRQYLGPNYCPELRIISNGELIRKYERGHEDDAKYLIWQASVGKTARECLYDEQGGLTLKVGFSGRVIAGPKGTAADVTVPFKMAVVKYKEAVLTIQDYSVNVGLPEAGSVVFTQVKEIQVPSPGSERSYILYVGFDVGEWDPMTGEAVIAAVAPPPPPPVDEPPPAPRKPKQPNVLPTPSDGFVLPQ
jgi:hypothetical protein